MKRLLICLLLVVLMIGLCGCSPSLDAGTIIEKSYSPAHKTCKPSVMVINKSFARIIPRWAYYHDHWRIVVENGDILDVWEVSKDYYESVEVGQWVERPGKDKE